MVSQDSRSVCVRAVREKNRKAPSSARKAQAGGKREREKKKKKKGAAGNKQRVFNHEEESTWLDLAGVGLSYRGEATREKECLLFGFRLLERR